MAKYKPTDEQSLIIDNDASALIIAAPGKGKTATAVAAAKEWLQKNNNRHQRAIFTSFSNAAVIRIAESAKIDLSSMECRRLHFRTFHSWAMDILRCYGRFAGLKSPAIAMDNIEEALISSECQWDPKDKDGYQRCLMTHAIETGKIAFELMLPLAISLLEHSPTIRGACGARYPLIIVDEFQDTKPEQWSFIKAIGETSRVLVLGDPNQMIYEKQHSLIVDRIKEFEEWKGVKKQVFSGKNFRCERSGIIEFADALLNGTRTDISKLDGVQTLALYPDQRRAALAATWAEIRRKAGYNVTVAFIVPSANTARQISEDLKNNTRQESAYTLKRTYRNGVFSYRGLQTGCLCFIRLHSFPQ